ncbi:hypothetical protein BC351_11075 [Paenibacillus ferrarius]|uniref:Uncharacterized protein n=1 Tax=Paenibacillus ferrarius TaxID=1469647 RepID=A0A1V4H994_9BACL|nr:hypothetical protein [Paenibacillus ferrarius]OPH47721.1 hypothetical protein BC351_11075 [Paenibacillus ferrarius]
MGTIMDGFSTFQSLSIFFALCEKGRPTQEQKDQALKLLIQLYGALSEEELIQRDDPDLLLTYKELKRSILDKAEGKL